MNKTVFLKLKANHEISVQEIRSSSAKALYKVIDYSLVHNNKKSYLCETLTEAKNKVQTICEALAKEVYIYDVC